MSGFINIFDVFLYVIKTKVTNDVIERWQIFWKLVKVWDTESLEDGIGSVTNMAASVLAGFLLADSVVWNVGSLLAINWVSNLNGALLYTDGFWIGLCLWEDKVVQEWEFLVLVDTAEMAVAVHWSEQFLGFTMLPSVDASETVSANRGHEQKPEKHIGALSVDHWPVSQLRVRSEILSVVVGVLERLARGFISHMKTIIFKL